MPSALIGMLLLKISSIYEMALVGGVGVTLSSENRAWNRFLGREGK